MSASDKKKLRKEQETAMLTQRQQQEQAEAKKLKAYTISFVAVLAVIVCIAVVTLGFNIYKQSGISEKSTIAAVVDGTNLNSVEMNYYYKDAINEMYNSVYSSMGSLGDEYVDMYMEAMGLEVATPLDEQDHPDGEGTWADFFVTKALDNAKSDFAMYNLAKEAGFTLSEEEQSSLDIQLSNLKSTAPLYGYANANDYLKAIYGYGASLKSYSEYLERAAIASEYYNDYLENMEYDDAAIRTYEKDKEANYNSYTYDYCYLSYNDFIEGGTEDENGTKTYTDEEKDAARAKAKEAAEKLATATSVEEMETMLEEIEVNETSGLAINAEDRKLHSTIDAYLAKWLSDEARTEGEIGVVANTTTDDAAIVNGYNVVCFLGKSDNKEAMSNVRHLLVQFEGGTTDDMTGETVYTDEEKATASTEAKSLMEKWESGEKTEERFIELVKEYSDDSSASTGGLFENIHPDSEYVPTFLEWSIDSARKAGDYGLIESPYGYHLMFYVGDSEMTYRDYMITEEMKLADIEDWYNDAIEAVVAEVKDLSKLELDMVLNPEHDHDHAGEEAEEDETEDESEAETEEESEAETEEESGDETEQ